MSFNSIVNAARLALRNKFGAVSLKASTTVLLTSVSAGSIVAALVDPYAGLGLGTTTYSTFGTVPAQLGLTGTNIVAGSTSAAASSTYNLGVMATSGDGKRRLGETLSFTTPAAAQVLAYSTADKYFIANAGGMRWPNRALKVGGTAPYFANYLVRKSAPWIVPAGTATLGFGLPNIRVIESNASVNEELIQSAVTVDAITIKYTDAGGVSRVVAGTLTNGGVLDPAKTDGGILATFSPTVAIPANSSMTIGISLANTSGTLIGGYEPAAGETGRSSTTASFATQVTASTSLAGQSGSVSSSLQNYYYGPAFMFAKGADGRPVFLNDGDSISFGKGTPGEIAVDGAAGLIEVPLHDTANGYAIPVVNTGVSSSAPSYVDPANANYNPNIAQYRRALIDQVSTLNGNVAPFSHYISEHGNNSLGGVYTAVAPFVAMMKIRHAWLKSWWNKPIVQTTMIQKATSSDAFRTVGNQVLAGGDATWDSRWQYNDKLMADKLDGSADFVVNTWSAIAYDQTTNRDKIAIAPFTAQTTRANNSAAASTTLYLNAAPPIGVNLALDPLSGSANAKIVTAVTTVTEGSEYAVTCVVGSSGSTYPAMPAGTLVGAQYFSDGTPAASGLHLCRVANDLISSWTGSQSYTELKAALKSAVNGTWS